MKRLCAIVLAALLPGAQAGACDVSPGAAVPLAVLNGQGLVDTAVNGQTVLMLLDTGAARSVLTDATVRRLGLPRSEWAAMTMRGAGGVDRQRVAVLRSFTLGGEALRRKTLSAEITMPVVALDQHLANGAPVGGLLGGDYLSSLDLDLDMPGHALTVHSVRGCGGRFISWTGAYDAIPAMRPNLDLLLLPVALDGHALLAELDSGAQESVLTPIGAARLGLTEATLAGDPAAPVQGVGPQTVRLRRHVFATVAIGRTMQHDVPMLVGPVFGLHSVDLFLGADWLARHRVWLSYATTQVFVAAAGR